MFDITCQILTYYFLYFHVYFAYIFSKYSIAFLSRMNQFFAALFSSSL